MKNPKRISVFCLAVLAMAASGGAVFKASLGDVKANLKGKEISAAGENAVFGEVDGWKCLKKGVLTFTIQEGFPDKRGIIAFRIRPLFEQKKDSPEITVIKFESAKDKMTFEYFPPQTEWRLDKLVGGQKDIAKTKNHELKSQQWNHVCIGWEHLNAKQNRMVLYVNGKHMDSKKFPKLFSGQVTVKIGGDNINTEIADLVILNKYLGRKGINKLCNAKPGKGPAMVVIKKKTKITIDPALQADIDKLKGKVGRLLYRHSTSKTPIELTDGIIAEPINPADIGKIDLSKYKVILFPQGPRYQVSPDQYKYIVDYVKNGGGYVGSCQGSYFANKLKLLDFKTYACDIWGLFAIYFKNPHIITGWREKKMMRMHFGNGPIMVPGEGCEVIATYTMTMPGKPTIAAIMTGKCGKGRVVLFGPHPMGGPISANGIKKFYSGEKMHTSRMMTNALLYAAGIIENKR